MLTLCSDLESALGLDIKPEHVAGIKKDITALAPGQFFDPGPATDELLRGAILHSMFPPVIPSLVQELRVQVGERRR